MHKRIKKVENRFEGPMSPERTDPPDPRYVEVSGVGSVWEVVPPMKTIALSVDSLEQFARPSKLLRSAFDLVFLGGEGWQRYAPSLPAQIRKCN